MSVVTRKSVLGVPTYEPEDGEKYMSSNQQAYFHNVLVAWYNALCSQTSDLKEVLQGNENFIDELDRASQEESQRMTLRSSDRRRKLQKKVSEAIARLQQGEYGFCKTCGESIGLSRLTVRPTAEQCINCKTVSEIYEKRGQE
jgi:DnaK suppressor protein